MFPAPPRYLALLSCALIFAARSFADDPCNPTDPPQEPASGKWKGTLDERASYKREVQSASVKMAQTWHGNLEFLLGHDTEYDERTEPEPPCLRVPAGHAPIEGCRTDGTRIDPNKKFKIVKVPRDGAPHLSGEARVTQSTSFSASVKGAQEHGSGATPPGPPESLNTELVLSGERIEAISLVGRPEQLRMSSQFSLHDRSSGAAASWSGTAGGNGVPYEHLNSQSPSGSVDASSHRDASGGVSTHAVYTDPSGKTHTEDLRTPGKSSSADPGKFVELFHMTLETRECGFMQGKIDAASMQSQMGGAGFNVEVPQAEWSATLEERDKAFEDEVKRFAAEPVPATLTWDYVDQFIARLQALQAAKKSDYGRCVLKKAESKGVRIQMQAIRTLSASYPSRCEGATDAVLNFANQRLISLIRPLGFLGLESCPDVEKAWKIVQESTSSQTKSCP